MYNLTRVLILTSLLIIAACSFLTQNTEFKEETLAKKWAKDNNINISSLTCLSSNDIRTDCKIIDKTTKKTYIISCPTSLILETDEDSNNCTLNLAQ